MLLKRRTKVFIWSAAGLIILGLLTYLIPQFLGTTKLPQEFLDARRDAAEVSQKIVDLTHNTNEKIKAVNPSEFSSDPDKAVVFIRQAQQSNSEAYNQAFELSRHLQKLAESLEKIKSSKGQRLAYEAVAVELSLVSEFILYTQDLNKFLENLAKATATDSDADRSNVEQSLGAVNQRVNKINDLNKEFLAKIEAFDSGF